MNPPRHWHKAAFAVIAFTAALFLSGCNLLSTKASTPSGTGGQNTAAVSLSSSSLSFGGVVVGSSKTMYLTLTNSTPVGGSDVTVSRVTVTGTGFSTTMTASVTLSPGQSTNIAVVFNPTATGNASGSLAMDVQGANNPATVGLSGNGTTSNTASAQLSVSPAALNFGNVNIGSSKNLAGTLQATNADVTVSSAAWNGTGYSVSGITFPTTIRAGNTKSFTVSFAPQSAGNSAGQISFVSSAANSPVSESFSGNGVAVAVAHTVTLTWTPSTSNVAGYNIYRSTQSGGPYSRINGALRTNSSYVDGGVQSGLTYFYVATAVDSNSVESAYSGEVAAVIPNP